MRGRVGLLAFAAASDIALSQWSFKYIDVDLYTITKSTSIVFILIFGVVLGLEKMQWRLLVIVFTIFPGIFMFSWKSPSFVLSGFSMALAASFLSGWYSCSLHLLFSALYHLLLLAVPPFFIMICWFYKEMVE